MSWPWIYTQIKASVVCSVSENIAHGIKIHDFDLSKGKQEVWPEV